MIRVRCAQKVTRNPIGRAAAEVLEHELHRRSAGSAPGGHDSKIVLDVEDGDDGGFEIAGSPDGGICVIGHTPAALFPGIGKFLRTGRWTRDSFEPSLWRGTSLPDKSVRGIYFATHFHNYYHEAPVEEITRYVQDLALWGCNALAVWFDMHHFRGIDDPAAREMIERLHGILRAANRVGIGGALIFIGNEGYDDSPAALRADWTAGHDGYHTEPGGHYHVEICPSRPGGMDYIRRTRREVLDAFADLDIRWVCIWPYDQGGCTCRDCAPWGANGFLRVAGVVAPMVKEVMPGAEVILSTWYFDHFTTGEWEGLARRIAAAPPSWLTCLLADDNGDEYPRYVLEHGVPGDAKLLNFPEISMYRMFPWGGYGANPLPRHIQSIWDSIGTQLSGGFPYSEGVYEDINKAICLQHYWSSQDAMQTVQEYATQYFGSDAAGALTEAVEGMERRHARNIARGHRCSAGAIDPSHDSPEVAAALECEDLSGAGECLAKVKAVENVLPDSARQDWRWRLLYLRAGIDAEIQRTGGRLNDGLEEMFQELVRFYHADRCDLAVAPPARQMLRRWCARDAEGRI
jgi:hypothetical protein